MLSDVNQLPVAEDEDVDLLDAAVPDQVQNSATVTGTACDVVVEDRDVELLVPARFMEQIILNMLFSFEPGPQCGKLGAAGWSYGAVHGSEWKVIK